MNRVLIFLLLLASCVEPFDFNRNNLDPQLVIEAYVSDISYNESLAAPSNGRYFEVKLKWTRPVSKIVDDRITPFADVKLIDDQNTEWTYHENINKWGTYILFDQDFKACDDRMYKLQVTTQDDFIYESAWEKLPSLTSSPVEDIWFEEDDIKTYYYPAGEEKIRDKKIINVSTTIPTNPDGQVRYYKWEYYPMWVYEAPLAVGAFSPFRKCWITNSLYLNEYALQEDVVGGTEQVLFSIDIEKNDRLYTNFSVLVYQQSTSKDYFYFSQLMQEQNKPNGIFDTPPANLPTNFTCINDPSKKPVGYFGVVSETTRRWYFNKDELSYFVENPLRENCLAKFNRPQDPPDPAEECLSCLSYEKRETATLTEPSWWIGN
ncbi:MAG: DUF4249 domain-containing protein [Reichenbachiella sp.]|uniref:DUF4249 domain-containing protein n=1 Tax=Reichenbachiella sp. TaxID=2184521 RepID=UPI0032658C97